MTFVEIAQYNASNRIRLTYGMHITMEFMPLGNSTRFGFVHVENYIFISLDSQVNTILAVSLLLANWWI